LSGGPAFGRVFQTGGGKNPSRPDHHRAVFVTVAFHVSCAALPRAVLAFTDRFAANAVTAGRIFDFFYIFFSSQPFR